jgi:hypothetical protein
LPEINLEADVKHFNKRIELKLSSGQDGWQQLTDSARGYVNIYYLVEDCTLNPYIKKYFY